MSRSLNFLGASALMFLLLLVIPAMAGAQPYYPQMQYGARQEIAPGVTWRTAKHENPKWSIHVIEVDMTSPSVMLVPVFKKGDRLEVTSAMAERVGAIAAINAGFFNMKAPYNSVSHTLINGKAASSGGGKRSSLGFGGSFQSLAACEKLDDEGKPSRIRDWAGILDAIGGRGVFYSKAGVMQRIDVEGTSGSHDKSRHPRTVIGYSKNPYKVFLVTVDGRQPKLSVGMNYTELARLMADLGAETSLSLDGGGSTTCWVKGKVLNSPSDGRQRSVVSVWAVVPGQTVDNRDPGVTWGGNWTRQEHPERYSLDHFLARSAQSGGGLSWIAWRPHLKQGGLYQVQAWWTDDPARAAAAPFQIKHRDGQAAVMADQRLNGGQWNTLGTYRFHPGSDGLVMLSNTAPGTISADALRFVRVGE